MADTKTTDAVYGADDVCRAVNELEAWTDGFMHGAKLDDEPSIFPRIKGMLYEYHDKLKAEEASGK